MELVQVLIGNGAVAVVVTLVGLYINSRTKDLKGELKDTRRELRADIVGLRNELKADIAEVRTELRDQSKEISALRTDVTRFALALGSRPHPQTG